MKKKEHKKQGKKNRAAGARFELKVRKDLEDKSWIVSKWMNNVEVIDFEYGIDESKHKVVFIDGTIKKGRLIPSKHRFRGPGIPMAIGTGFPDFIAFKFHKENKEIHAFYEVIGVECKSGKYLDKTEKEKCRWLLENHIFSLILIAYKGEKRGEIKYQEA